MWYHAGMRKPDIGGLSRLYLLLMCSLFPLAVSPRGYLDITETKYAVFCVLTALYLLPAAFLCLRKRLRWRKPVSAVRLLLLAYWGWSLVSALASPWKGTALLGGARCDGFITVTLYCAVFLCLSRFGGRDRFPLWVPAAALSLLCLTAILQFFDLNPLRLYPGSLRWSGRERDYNGAFLSLIGNADLTASVLCTGFALLWPLGVQKRSWPLLASALLCLGVLAASGIRAGLLGAGASLLLCLPAALPLGKAGRRRLWAALGMACVVALLLVYFVPMSGYAGELRALLRGQAQDSFGSGRVYIWKEVWRLVKERPLLGGGPDTLGERGLAFVKTAADGGVLRRTIDCAHCEALNILVNQGLPALLFLAGALLLTLLHSLRCGGPAAVALRSAMIAYLAASFFGIGMPANAAFFWLIWAMLEREITEANANH